MNQTPKPAFLTPQDAATELQMSYWLILREIESGRLPAKRISNRYRIARADFDRYLAACTVEARHHG